MDTNAENTYPNPFTPTFGSIPERLAGRRDIVNRLTRALDCGVRHPEACSLLTGARGTGKTALLSYMVDKAAGAGFVYASVTAEAGMLEDILQRSYESALQVVAPKDTKRVKSLAVSGLGSIEWEWKPEKSLNWRSQMNGLLDSLAEAGSQLLITVDEVDCTLDEMKTLVTVYQHFVREGRPVLLFMAGLPHNIAGLVSGKSTSFLRRASRFDIGNLPDYEVEEAFRLTIRDAGRTIGKEALKRAVAYIGGFPYMMQLLGFRAWEAAERDSSEIGIEAIEEGYRMANKELEARIFRPTYQGLSNGDRAFLHAMLPDKKSTARSDLTTRLGKGSSHVSAYKRRLLEAGIIEEPDRGVYTFALPGFREYVALMEE